MKKGPLSNKEKDFITKSLPEFEGEIEKLAEGMERSHSIVSKFVKSLQEQEKPKGQTAELFAKKEERGVTVMTESASMAGDESKQGRTSQTPARYRQFIHKIKEQ
jgi:hypothetical protein